MLAIDPNMADDLHELSTDPSGSDRADSASQDSSLEETCAEDEFVTLDSNDEDPHATWTPTTLSSDDTISDEMHTVVTPSSQAMSPPHSPLWFDMASI